LGFVPIVVSDTNRGETAVSAKYRIRLAFMGEPSGDMPTVIEACDEHTEDAWNGIPDFFAEGVERAENSGSVVRQMIVELPESAVRGLFEVPTVAAEVVR
jgi:hypothetical protein